VARRCEVTGAAGFNREFDHRDETMFRQRQELLFPDVVADAKVSDKASSTFIDNMSRPIHRWFRYSAGFSAKWIAEVIHEAETRDRLRVFDPFAGSATTLLAAEALGAESWGVEAHPFICRIARAKLQWRSDPDAYQRKIKELRDTADCLTPSRDGYPPLIYKCYERESLAELDVLRQAFEIIKDDSPASELLWLTLVAILRKTSCAGTAQWQYILPRKRKRSAVDVRSAYSDCARMIHRDMLECRPAAGPKPRFIQGDARTCGGVPDRFANLVVTSPPYPNNYDYADATRLEMSFFREINGWGDLQGAVRSRLVRSCSQHVPERSLDLAEVLAAPELEPIRQELSNVCEELAEVRKTKGGKKTYHLMVACYFHDLALVWRALRRVCESGAKVCFVIGDSAPYGVYVPVVPWLGALAEAAGFHAWRFEETRQRNIKWKNRKHRVPLKEGRLWVEG
jgi:DNA methylase